MGPKWARQGEKEGGLRKRGREAEEEETEEKWKELKASAHNRLAHFWRKRISAKRKEERCARNPSEWRKTANQLGLLNELRLLLVGIFLPLISVSTRRRPQHPAQEIQHHGAIST